MNKSSRPKKAKSASKRSKSESDQPVDPPFREPGYTTGRPTKYRPEYCEQIVEFCSTGKSLTAFAASLGSDKSTLLDWAKKFPEFSTALKAAKAKCEAFMENVGMHGMNGRIKGFQGNVYIFWMKARFGWRDEPEPELPDENTLEFI